jgi:5-methylcytosine-specific restriction protein A
MPVLKPCPGCAVLVPLTSRRCAACEAQRQVQLAARRGTTTQRGLGWSYQRRRAVILKRDGYVCGICGGLGAVSVDHKVPRSLGGDDSDSNLRAAHKRCNERRGAGRQEYNDLPRAMASGAGSREFARNSRNWRPR